jgi:hypothetical protein
VLPQSWVSKISELAYAPRFLGQGSLIDCDRREVGCGVGCRAQGGTRDAYDDDVRGRG